MRIPPQTGQTALSSGKKRMAFLYLEIAVTSLVLPGTSRNPNAQWTSRGTGLLMEMATNDAESVPVPAAFFKTSPGNLKDKAEYDELYKRSIEDPANFWGDIASQFHWEEPWEEVVDSNFASSKGRVFTSWFNGGKTNVCFNALDRHVQAGHGRQMALIHEANEEGEGARERQLGPGLDLDE